MVFGLLCEFVCSVLFLPAGGFMAIFLLREKSDTLGTFNMLSKETPLDVGLLVLPVERIIEVVIVTVVATSDSRDGSRSSSLLTMLRPSLTSLTSLLAFKLHSHVVHVFYHIHSSRHTLCT